MQLGWPPLKRSAKSVLSIQEESLGSAHADLHIKALQEHLILSCRTADITCHSGPEPKVTRPIHEVVPNLDPLDPVTHVAPVANSGVVSPSPRGGVGSLPPRISVYHKQIHLISGRRRPAAMGCHMAGLRCHMVILLSPDMAPKTGIDWPSSIC